MGCLVELGYGATTTSAVAERAGVSRGAHLHHFGTRQRLIGAAVEHLGRQRLEAVQSAAFRLPDDDTRPRRALDLLSDALSGPLYAAALELYTAARVDEELRLVLVPVEQRLTRALRGLCREFVTDDPTLVQLTMDLLLGRGVGSLLSPVRTVRQRQALDAWAQLLPGGNAR